MGQRTLLDHLRPSAAQAEPSAASQSGDSGSGSGTHLRAAPKRKSSAVEQNFDFFLVLDFEATCDERKNLDPQVCHLFL